jgi:TPR repeat protein
LACLEHKDITAAAFWLAKSADAGNVEAMCVLDDDLLGADRRRAEQIEENMQRLATA